MKSIQGRLGLIGLSVVLIVTGCGKSLTIVKDGVPQRSEIHVSAAISLKDALTEIERNYHTSHPNETITFNFGSSGSLQRQIEQGAPADLFFSASTIQMDLLEVKQLIDKATRQNIVQNELVVVVPRQSAVVVGTLNDLAKTDVRQFAMGEPQSVPAGQYAKEALLCLDVWEQIKDKVVFAKDVRTVLTYVATGNVEAGLVYRTDAMISNQIMIAMVVPRDLYASAIYPGAVLTGAKQPEAAAEFLRYLACPEAKAIFQKYGFSTL